MSAPLTTSAIVSLLMPRRLQYADSSQTSSGFTPLLELQAWQQSEMFSLVIMSASFTMCSQVGGVSAPNTEPQ